jgi:hypothetical protein
MASELRVNTLKDAAGNNSIATSFVAGGSAKAYANFSATAIVKSLNYSSFVDNGTGDHTVTVTSALSDINYTYGGFSRATSSTAYDRGATPDGEDPTTTQQRYHTCGLSNGTLEDMEANFTVIHGDLA